MNEYVPDIDLLCERLLAAIKPYLKAPSTAVLCSPDELQIVGGADGSYVITGIVHAQNGFGAMIATDFLVQAEYMEGNWYCNKVMVGLKTDNPVGNYSQTDPTVWAAIQAWAVLRNR